jgi:hypothetical protein
MTEARPPYFLHVARERGGVQRVYGPFATYNEAHQYGLPFAQEGLDVEMKRPPGVVICDFCSDRDVKWSYPAADFRVPEVEWGSRGHWAACQECYDLIEKNDRRGLLDRSVETFFVHHSGEGVPDSKSGRLFIRRHVTMIHGEFFQNRVGGPKRES